MDFKCDELISEKTDADSRALTRYIQDGRYSSFGLSLDRARVTEDLRIHCTGGNRVFPSDLMASFGDYLFLTRYRTRLYQRSLLSPHL